MQILISRIVIAMADFKYFISAERITWHGCFCYKNNYCISIWNVCLYARCKWFARPVYAVSSILSGVFQDIHTRKILVLAKYPYPRLDFTRAAKILWCRAKSVFNPFFSALNRGIRNMRSDFGGRRKGWPRKPWNRREKQNQWLWCYQSSNNNFIPFRLRE